MSEYTLSYTGAEVNELLSTVSDNHDAWDSISQETYSLNLGTLIPEEADLNDYMEVGNYYCIAATTKTLTNAPKTSDTISLKVINMSTETSIERTQIVTARTDGRTFVRSYPIYVDDGVSYEWSEWYCSSGVDSIVAEGTSNNIRWIKFSNGTALLAAKSTHVGAISSTYNNNSYKGSNIKVSLPFAVLNAYITAGLSGNWQATSIFVSTSDDGTSFLWFPISSGSNATTTLSTTAYFIIWGTWK